MMVVYKLTFYMKTGPPMPIHVTEEELETASANHFTTAEWNLFKFASGGRVLLKMSEFSHWVAELVNPHEEYRPQRPDPLPISSDGTPYSP